MEFDLLLINVVLIMRKINLIINMDDIRQEGPNEGSVLKLNKRLEQTPLNKIFVTHAKESVTFKVLKK